MKKYLFFLLMSMAFAKITTAQANHFFKPFKVDIGLGPAAQPSQPDGLLIYMEPSYSFTNYFKAGIRLEEAVLSMKDIGSSALTFDYYFTNNHVFRPFAGGGFSYYSTSSYGGCDPGPTSVKTVRSTKNSGAFLRTGFEVNHFRFSIEYNFVPPTYVSAVDAEGHATATSTVIYKNGYFGIKAGICIGGGRKKK